MDTRSKRKSEEQTGSSTKKLKTDSNEQQRCKNTEKLRKWRAKQKLDTEKYETMKQKDKERKREQRQKQKPQAQTSQKKMEELRKKKREEMQKYREKVRKHKACQKGVEVPESRSGNPESTSGIIYINQMKGVSGKILQKQLAVKRTQEWRMRIRMKNSEPNSTQQCSQDSLHDTDRGFTSKFSKSRKIRKVKTVLPRTPKKKAEVIKHLLDSPATSKILSEDNVILSPECRKKLEIADAIVSSVRDSLDEVNVTVSKDSEKDHAFKVVCAAILKKSTKRRVLAKRVLQMSYRSRQLKREWWAKQNRKKRSDVLSDEVKQSVRNFYLSPEVSREVPCKKDVLKIKGPDGQKQLVQKHVMTMTLEDAHKMYKSKFPQHKIGLTMFRKIKPENVRKVSETSRRSCLCQVCCNVALKVEALQKHVKTVSTDKNRKILDKVSIDKSALSDATFCQYEGTPSSKCLTRECEKCSVDNLDKYLKPVTDESNHLKVMWYQWRMTEISKGDQVKKCVACLPKEGSYKEFMAEMKKDFSQYPEHRFRAAWQQQQMSNCINGLKQGSVALVMDFSENYGCVYQNEAQSGFFERNQVTVHPMMAYYKRSSVDRENNQEEVLVKHAIIGISNDTKHDSDAVKMFESKAIDRIIDQGVKVEEIHEWTDGCAAQYKGKKSFADISLQKLPVTRNFFETSHGKSVCDGLGATVKNVCYRAVVSGKKVISDASDVFTFCEEKLKRENSEGEKISVSLREFISLTDIERNRNETEVQTLKGTRKLHVVRSTGKDYVLDTRNLSCYCDMCTNHQNDCENKEYVCQWEKKTMKKTANPNSQEGTDIVQTATDRKQQCAREPVPKPSSSSAETETETIIKPGTFVAVSLESSRGCTSNIYIAEVLNVSNNGSEVRYMKKSGNMYIWPDASKEEITCEPEDRIVGTLTNPQLINERGFFKFSASQFEKIRSKQLEKYKHVYFK